MKEQLTDAMDWILNKGRGAGCILGNIVQWTVQALWYCVKGLAIFAVLTSVCLTGLVAVKVLKDYPAYDELKRDFYVFAAERSENPKLIKKANAIVEQLDYPTCKEKLKEQWAEYEKEKVLREITKAKYRSRCEVLSIKGNLNMEETKYFEMNCKTLQQHLSLPLYPLSPPPPIKIAERKDNR